MTMKGSCCDMTALQKHASTVYTELDYWYMCQPACHWSICHPELYWFPFRHYINDSRMDTPMRPLEYVIEHGSIVHIGDNCDNHKVALHLMSLGAKCDDVEYVRIVDDPPRVIRILLLGQNNVILARKLVRSGVLFDLDDTLLHAKIGADKSTLVDRCKDFDAYVKLFHNNVKILQLIKGIRHFKRSPERWNLVPREIVDRIIEIAKELIKFE